MNDLSWMIYLADVADSANDGLGIIAGLLAVVGGIGCWGYSCYLDDEVRDKAPAVSLAKKLAATVAAMTLAVIAIPSSDTVYAIAASEMGEEIAKSETAGKAMQALDAWLDRQIAGEASDAQ